ncbi:hypothetical protein O1611_g7188 [Lasiodiplodia mahajangana]|uniref:Uncharacterized protein n=1 Tax=Lasiodiplodia mahajangana TaxID=1108764 RepID=A0ACC2JGE4_9PEZI|nr:hypothetical protein O1611_g7188 [Lasiodiplodia mahajangana]
MPASDTASSTIHPDLDISTDSDGPAVESSDEKFIEDASLKQVSLTENAKTDLEKGGDDPASQQPGPPPGLNPADFPDGGFEAIKHDPVLG